MSNRGTCGVMHRRREVDYLGLIWMHLIGKIGQIPQISNERLAQSIGSRSCVRTFKMCRIIFLGECLCPRAEDEL